MLENLPADLRQAVGYVESLFDQYAVGGAADSEPEAVFHDIIRQACALASVDWRDVDWDLYDHRDAEREQQRAAAEAKPKLTTAARLVYDIIRIKYTNNTDVCNFLQAYAWRGHRLPPESLQ